MDEIKRQRLIKLINEYAVRRGEFLLASGHGQVITSTASRSPSRRKGQHSPPT